MTFYKPPRQSDADAGRFFGSSAQAAADRAADPFFAGQQAFWATQQRRPPDRFTLDQREAWCRGWDTAGLEAARVLRQTRAVQAIAKTVRDTIEDAGRLFKRIDETWVKKPMSIKQQMSAARIAINGCLLQIPAIEAAQPKTSGADEGGAAAGA